MNINLFKYERHGACHPHAHARFTRCLWQPVIVSRPDTLHPPTSSMAFFGTLEATSKKVSDIADTEEIEIPYNLHISAAYQSKGAGSSVCNGSHNLRTSTSFQYHCGLGNCPRRPFRLIHPCITPREQRSALLTLLFSRFALSFPFSLCSFCVACFATIIGSELIFFFTAKVIPFRGGLHDS